MTIRSKLWLAGAIGCVGIQVIAALVLKQSFQLAALSDLVQCLLLASGLIAVLPHAFKSEGRVRLFWILMGMGIALWLAYQLLWTYFEVVLRTDVPDLFAGDIILFLHIVPMIAALALRPHTEQDEYSARLGQLDFALLATAWVYLWALMILPWQYAQADVVTYNQNFNIVYLAEKLAFLVALAAAWSSSKAEWRASYGQFLAANFTYAASSYVANWAIGRNVYYSGSLYDVPLTLSMAWFTYVGLTTSAHQSEPSSGKVDTTYGVWMARLGMLAALSLPLFGAWTLYANEIPDRVRSFRIVLTLATAIAMGTMVFIRQHLLDRELLQLLASSQRSFEELNILQTQVTESEKLASMGRLVGGVAHELNNPITAMLGYSDLLRDTRLPPQQSAPAEKIGQHIRRIQSLVASLLSFAKPSPSTRGAVDLNTLARTAMKLSEAQHKALKLEVRIELASEMPPLHGDSNQLLQVLTHMISTALYDGDGTIGGTLLIATSSDSGWAVFQVCHWTDAAAHGSSPRSQSEELGHGLGVCRGIVQEHRGRLDRSLDPDGRVIARLELPATLPLLKTAQGKIQTRSEPVRSFV